jgi:SAM-dependent methyltransferase
VTDPAGVDNLTYLEAKFSVDSGSLNRRVFGRFRRCLERMPDPRLLDLGTGTGAMLRRFLDLNLKGAPLLVGVDRDTGSLTVARGKIAPPEAAGGGRGTAATPPRVRLHRMDLVRAALHPQRRGGVIREPFDCISAHALMDLLPLQPVLDWVRTLLRPEGLFYATLNYEGLTRFTPPYGDPEFEAALLGAYNRSMDSRRVEGLSSGGSRSGSRLRAALEEQGFRLLARGRSDWRVRLRPGAADRGASILSEALLGMIYRELSKAGAPPERAAPLASWYRSRLRDLREKRLGLHVSHLDILARKHGGPSLTLPALNRYDSAS